MKKMMHNGMPIVIIIIGLLLFGIGSLPSCTPAAVEQKEPTEEQRLSDILSRVSGAGAVFVFIAYEDAGEIVPVFGADGDVVILRQEQEVIGATRVKSPKVDGILIVAEGAENADVRASLISSVRALYGTELSRISVLKGKSVK